ncbi:MAG: hypothetical protein HFH87_07130 [Lachnospiraceae bacterium]|nr:hypothetical protein [Lachnospiraceae bacterium]
MTRKEKFEKFYENGYLSHAKILYSGGGYKYANLFSLKDYEMGKKIGSIVGYRHMNIFERFLYRNNL